MNRYLYSLLFLILSGPFWGSQVMAADQGPASLQEDLVTVEGSKYVIDKDLHCTLRLPLSLGGGAPFNDFGMHVRFAAPEHGLISRDMFVALSMRIFTEYRIRLVADVPGLTNEQTLKAMECQEAAEPEEQAEYLFRVNMSPEGVKSTIINQRLGTKRVTIEPWREILRFQPQEK